MIAKVALKTVSGMDLPVSEFFNALKEGVGEEVADYLLDGDTLHRVALGQEGASPGMQAASKRSYDAITQFMIKGGFADFDQTMERVPDGKGEGGMVWVSNRNRHRWERLHEKKA